MLFFTLQSFAADADIEDLGVNVFKSTNKPLPAAPDLTSTLAPPACEPVLAPVNVTMSGGQTLVQPRTLPQLVVVSATLCIPKRVLWSGRVR